MSKPLVCDASTAVAEVLRQRGLRLFQDDGLELYMSEAAWSETRHELAKRVAIVAERHGLMADERDALLSNAIATLNASLNVVPTEAYAPFEATARGRIPQDPSDWPSVALALAIDVGVWTEDRDFFGSGLATWRTPILSHYLTTETQ